MKALSIKQPWLHAILREGKHLENRSWKTPYRGWLALHASGKAIKDAQFPSRTKVPDLKTLDYSAICGVAKLSDIVMKSRSKWFYRGEDDETTYGWVLTEVVALEDPIPCPGSLGLWKVPADVIRKLKRRLPEVDFTSPYKPSSASP